MKTIRLLKQLQYIAAGTVLKKNAKGDYFITMPDEVRVHGPVQSSVVEVSGEFIRSNPDYYEVIEGEKTKLMLIDEAFTLVDPENKKLIALLNRAKMAPDYQ
ncbi:MAG: hypothetical protein CL840_01345 [Crocinitomicaceae bacterium]|nr:hypothetical protein [Crocinitomicaceae bacterium]|tara:strand:+ start:25974 stop:26279 length:306 start_codon:yes stop_codon:yes gene_type:complete